MLITENLDTFLADFGVPVVSGALSGVGLFNCPDQVIGGAFASVSTEYTVEVKTSVFGALTHNSAITVDGVAYTVKRVPEKLGDGAFCRIYMEKN